MFSVFANAQECEYFSLDKKFKNGDIAYLFGDNVRLRTAPSSKSETIKLLKIGSPIHIIEMTNKRNFFKGIKSPWYKVKYKKEIGYIIGGLISLTQRKNNKLRCFINIEIINSKLYILTRVLSNSETDYYENKSISHGDNSNFCLNLFDNKGVPGINNIIYINYLPESCGANSGGYYLFFDNKKLYKVIDLTSRGDIGFWESERLLFPKDSLGIKNKIIYIKEKGEDSDSLGLKKQSEEDEPYWEKSSTLKQKLEWVDYKLKPNPKKLIKIMYK